MSQWQNPSWPPQPPTSLRRSSPEKPEIYPYNLPLQKFMRHPYMGGEFDASAVAPPHAHGVPSEMPPNVAMTYPQQQQQQPPPPQPPQPQSRTTQGPVRYVPPGYIPSGDFVTTNNYHVPTEKWDPMGMPVGNGEAGGSDKRTWPKPESDADADTDTSPHASAAAPATRGRLDLQSGQKVTKRSRMGCLTCRQRKKRCCESRPRCTECKRLGLNCLWPIPGTEHKNKPKEVKSQENMIDHDIYGKIKVLRGIVEYRSNSWKYTKGNAWPPKKGGMDVRRGYCLDTLVVLLQWRHMMRAVLLVTEYFGFLNSGDFFLGSSGFSVLWISNFSIYELFRISTSRLSSRVPGFLTARTSTIVTQKPGSHHAVVEFWSWAGADEPPPRSGRVSPVWRFLLRKLRSGQTKQAAFGCLGRFRWQVRETCRNRQSGESGRSGRFGRFGRFGWVGGFGRIGTQYIWLEANMTVFDNRREWIEMRTEQGIS